MPRRDPARPPRPPAEAPPGPRTIQTDGDLTGWLVSRSTRERASGETMGSMLTGSTAIGMAAVGLGVMAAQWLGRPPEGWFEAITLKENRSGVAVLTFEMPTVRLLGLPVAGAAVTALGLIGRGARRRLSRVGLIGLVASAAVWAACWCYFIRLAVLRSA